MNEQKQEGFTQDYSAEIPLKEKERGRVHALSLYEVQRSHSKRKRQRRQEIMFNLSE